MKELLTFDQLLTWEDILALGDTMGNTSMYFGRTFFYSCCLKNHHKNMFDESIEKYVFQDFLNQFPDFPFSMETYDFRLCFVKDEQGNWKFRFSKAHFVLWLLEITNEDKSFPEKEKVLTSLLYSKQDIKQRIKDVLVSRKLTYSQAIRDFSDSYKTLRYDISSNSSVELSLSYLHDKRSKINWCLRHLDEMFAYFDKNVDVSFLQVINKDKFLLNMAGNALINSKIFDCLNSGITIDEFLDSIKDDSRILSSLNYLNNYVLMIEYLNSENCDKYDVNVNLLLKGRDFIFTASAITNIFYQFDSVMNGNPIYLSREGRYSSYQELLSSKASKTWKKIQNEKLAHNIQLNWEMIPNGQKVSLSNYSKNSQVRVVSSNSEGKAELKRNYDLVEKKMEYFASTHPLFELTGINTFTGYSAYMYSNGVVVFEKFFKNADKGKNQLLVPVSGEAIYIMNFNEFANLSKYSKPELIQEISQYRNPNVKRILHTSNGSWKDRVDKIITGPGYGELDLEQIEILSSELVKEEKEKVILKK